MHDFSSDFTILSPDINISQEWTNQVPHHENHCFVISVAILICIKIFIIVLVF